MTQLTYTDADLELEFLQRGSRDIPLTHSSYDEQMWLREVLYRAYFSVEVPGELEGNFGGLQLLIEGQLVCVGLVIQNMRIEGIRRAVQMLRDEVLTEHARREMNTFRAKAVAFDSIPKILKQLAATFREAEL